MDPITHAASGALLAYALPKDYRPETRLFPFFAALMAASPDIDVVFANTPLNYLLLHRGITHSLFAVPFMAVLLAMIAYPLLQKRTKRLLDFTKVTDYIPRKPWTFMKTVVLAVCCLLLHIWLDVVTTYGTMIFVPVSEYRVRLNGVFIVDILLTGTLLLTLWHGSKFRPYAIMGLIWVFLYPAACVGVRVYHEGQIQQSLQQEAMVQKRGELVGLTVYPDALAPLYWRAVYQTQKPYERQVATAFSWPQGKSRVGYEFPSSEATVYQQGFTLWGAWHTPLMAYPALSAEAAQSLAVQSRRARAFLEFCVFPVQERKSVPTQAQSARLDTTLAASLGLSAQGEPLIAQNENADSPAEEMVQEWGIYDLRFSTMLKSLYEFLIVRSEGRPTFLLEAKGANESWQEVRLVFAGSGQDSGWQKPIKPTLKPWYERLVGIEY